MNSTETELSVILTELGLAPMNKGFLYLKTALELCAAEPIMVTNLSRLLYPAVAEHFSTSPSNIEKSIRQSINKGWSNRNKAVSDIVFKNMRLGDWDIPTNRMFIAAVREYLCSANIL